MTVNGIKCKRCGRGLYSRARHDFRSCPCGSGVAIDGGRDYTRVSFVEYEDFEAADFEIEALSTEIDLNGMLYEDWYFGNDRYGIIERTT